MPVKSEAQAKLMRAVEHSPEFAKKVGIPQRVGAEMLHPTTKAMILANALRRKNYGR